MSKKTTKKKVYKNIPQGIAHIKSTFNNTIITITRDNGEPITWGSAGRSGYKGTKKSTPFAAQGAAEAAAKEAMEHGIQRLDIRVNGSGAGREAAIRAIQAVGIEIKSIKDNTPIAFGGCRPPKARRL